MPHCSRSAGRPASERTMTRCFARHALPAQGRRRVLALRAWMQRLDHRTTPDSRTNDKEKDMVQKPWKLGPVKRPCASKYRISRRAERTTHRFWRVYNANDAISASGTNAERRAASLLCYAGIKRSFLWRVCVICSAGRRSDHRAGCRHRSVAAAVQLCK